MATLTAFLPERGPERALVGLGDNLKDAGIQDTKAHLQD